MASEESRDTCIRTSADVLEHALVQAEYLAEACPEYATDVVQFGKWVDKVSRRAKDLGHRKRAQKKMV